jgi:hypothetical protein
MSLADEPPLRDLPDRAIRQGLQHPEHLRDLLRQELQSRREDLLAILEERFGVVPVDLFSRISAISDIEQLRRAIRQAVKVQNLEELQL